jgi:hypothetical protein
MLEINEQTHEGILISSLNKVYNKGRVYGKLKALNLFILNLTFKLLDGCCLELTNAERRQLLDIYRKIYFNSEDVCNSVPLSKYELIQKSKFTQAEVTDCNEYTKFENIYYWQEENLSTRYADVYPLSKVDGFTKDKLFDKETVFEVGKFIPYTKIGVIGFFITDTKSNDVYKIYDYLDNDVTDLFDQIFVVEKNSILFVSKNIYSHGIMKFKIKKIITNQGIFDEVFNTIFE